MYDLNHDMLEALKATPEILSGLVAGKSADQVHNKRGGDEGWSVVEVLCHLRDAEEISIQRMEAMRDQDNPSITSYDQEALAREHNYQKTELLPALAGFTAYRERLLAVLSSLTPEQWERTGRHTEIGQITIFAYAIHKASHDAIHCAQIARQLGTDA
jgi:hypothetical protein